jgi:hypothetical protein
VPLVAKIKIMKYFFSILVVAILASCNSGEKIPDVSDIKVEITTKRFEKDFFTMDTSNMDASLTKLQNEYPEFFPDFLEGLLGIDSKMIQSGEANLAIKSFRNSYSQLYDSSKIVFSDFSNNVKEIKSGLQFVKYYFPSYKLPTQIVTFIAPLDASFKTSFGLQGDIINSNVLGAGLQLHMGSNFSFYNSEQGQQLYPTYISKRFEPNTIAINCMKNIVDDMFPEKVIDKSLVQQMVEKGKRLYLLSKFLPREDEFKIIGYTKEQLKNVYKNERVIWDLFVQNNLLQTIDENIIKNYIGESPKTQELGDASPGNIGAFAGWQIVKKYMQKNPELSLQKLMATDNDVIFQEAKYKP